MGSKVLHGSTMVVHLAVNQGDVCSSHTYAAIEM